MAAVMLQMLPGFCRNYSKKPFFLFKNIYEKYIMGKEYCIAHHDDKTCFPLICRDHIFLRGDIKELLQ